MNSCVAAPGNETSTRAEVIPTTTGAHFKATDPTDTVEAVVRVQDSSAPSAKTISDEHIFASSSPSVTLEIESGVEAAEADSTNLTGDGGTMPASAKTPGKFAPLPKSLKTLTTAELYDRITELNTHVGTHNMSFTVYRRALGQALDEMRTRIAAAGGQLVIQEREPAVSWDGYCALIGVSRRSAFNWAKNWKTISEAPENLVDAAGRAGIDLYRPKIVTALKSITKENNDRILSDADLPALLGRLEASGKRNSGAASSKKAKLQMDPNPKEWTRRGVSVGDAQKFCSEVFAKLPEEEKDANPLFLAFTHCSPSSTLRDIVRIVFRYLVRNGPIDEQRAIAETIAEAAQVELDFIREQQTRQATSTTPEPPLGESGINIEPPSEPPPAANTDGGPCCLIATKTTFSM